MRLHLQIRFFLLFVITGVAKPLYAQHYQFSQFYASQTYLNPAFAGSSGCTRVMMTYRDQWPTVPGTFVTSQISVDHYVKELKSGIGILFFNDMAGSGALKSTQFSLLYAYEFKLSKKIMVRTGLSMGGIQRSIDYSTLLFGDQIARGGAATSVENISTPKVTYFDVGSGVLMYTANSWLGFSGSHLNTPNQSLKAGVSTLPADYKVHGGYRIVMEDDDASKKTEATKYMSFAFNYQHQYKFDQLDLGFYYTKNPFVLGLWYRGIPLFKAYKPGYSNNGAIIFLAGVVLGKCKIGYSYDLTISKLTNVNSGGAHEVTLSYQFCAKPHKRKLILISCPKF
ncbi:MAG TPA: type IX secretion system membrane protein PorP/SprF [Bacteroidia bacterium]